MFSVGKKDDGNEVGRASKGDTFKSFSKCMYMYVIIQSLVPLK